MRNRKDFAARYNLADPRPYFTGLRDADYRLPAVACRFLLQSAAQIAQHRHTPRLRVLDFAGGYGVNGALLAHKTDLAEIYDRFALTESGYGPDLFQADRRHFAARRRPEALFEVHGLDIAEQALAYGVEMGFYQGAFAENLVSDAPSPALASHLKEVDVVMETGALGETLPPSFHAILSTSGPKRPWILLASRPDVDDGPLNQVFQRHGYTVELCTAAPFRYRRLASAQERTEIFRNTAALGRDPEAAFRDDYFWVDLLLARHQDTVHALPMTDLVGQGLRID